MSTNDQLLDRIAKMLHEKYCSSLVMGDEIPWDDKIGKGRWYRDAQAILAAIRPHISAAVREWADGEIEVYEPDTYTGDQLGRERTRGRLASLHDLANDADAIAERVTGAGK